MILALLFVCLLQPMGIEKKVLVGVEKTVKEFYADSTVYQTSVSLKWMPSVLSRVSPDDVTGISYMGRGKPVGTGIFAVRFKAGARTLVQNVQVHVQVKQLLPVFNRRVMPGERLNAAETEMLWVELTTGMGDLVSEPAALDSVVVTGIIQPGMPVKRSEIKLIPIVLPGQELSVSFINSGLAVTMACKAREEAAVGDRIRVWSESTRKNYLVTVQSRETALWVSTL